MRRRARSLLFALVLALGCAWGAPLARAGESMLTPQPTGFEPEAAQPSGFAARAAQPTGFSARQPTGFVAKAAQPLGF